MTGDRLAAYRRRVMADTLRHVGWCLAAAGLGAAGYGLVCHLPGDWCLLGLVPQAAAVGMLWWTAYRYC